MGTQPLSARELILTLIDSASSNTLSASYFVAAGELFDMDSGGIRVALARLVRDGSLKQVERGTYALGSRAGTLHSLVRNWSQVESSVKVWDGGWLAVFTAHLARSDKTKMRGRERALGLFGFAQAHTGLWIRPDNLSATLTELHQALGALGLDDAAIAFVVSELATGVPLQPRKLWDCAALEQRYAGHIEALAESTERLQTLPDVAAAKETLLLGRAVTRDILLDPLLPAELLNTALRQEMVDAMRGYDRTGKSFWRAFHDAHNRPGA